jgi:hypothetical protein
MESDQKGSKGLCDIPYKNIQEASKRPPKNPFLTFCMEDRKGFRHICRIATMTSRPLHGVVKKISSKALKLSYFILKVN